MGSTHNFLDKSVAEKLKCTLKRAGLTKVTVADGHKLGVSAFVDGLEWNFQSITFKVDFMVIHLGGCDMVLGVQWLQQWGPITWDFQNLTMLFKMDRRKVLLHGIREGSIREVKAAKLKKHQENSVQLSMICTQMLTEQT